MRTPLTLPRLTLLLALLALPAQADALADLKNQLGRLQGGDPVKASVDYSFWRQVIEDKKPTVTQGKASAQVEDGPGGVRIAWSRPLLQQALAESKAQAQNPEKTAPTRDALGSFGPLGMSENLNYASALLREFERAQVEVLQQRAQPWNGQPATLLLLKATPKMAESQRKYIKDLKVDAKLWVGQDGLPLAYASAVKFKGSRFFITFEGSSSDEWHFARVGNRLVVKRVDSENSQSGFGQQSQRKSTTVVTVN
jgi:hypothetical protein